MNKEQRIKNYTTSIGWMQTVNEIERMLVDIGAEIVIKNYRGDGRIESLSFKYEGRGYRLPSNTEKCVERLKKIPGHKRNTQDLEAQAERVAWRVIKDWLDAQIALIRIGQAEVQQVMLPYMWDGKQSLYDRLKENQFMLPDGKKRD